MNAHPESMQPDAPGSADGDRPDFDESSGPPYRAIAMVLLAAVVLAIGIGLVQLFGGDDEDPVADEQSTSQVEDGVGDGAEAGDPGADGAGADGTADGEAPEPAPGDPDEGQPPAGEGQPGEPGDGQAEAAPGAGPDVTSVPVQVLNNSLVEGLAGRTGEQLRESGFAVDEVGNLASDLGVVSETTVYYGTGPGEQQAAEAVAAQLGAQAAPRPSNLATDAQGVIVIVTQDLDG